MGRRNKVSMTPEQKDELRKLVRAQAHDILEEKHPHMLRDKCIKQEVVAMIFTPNGGVYVGTNYCRKPQTECPRLKIGMGSGEGYELCNEICSQVGHAEKIALRLAGSEAKGGTLFLVGHTRICEDCKRAINKSGIHEVIIL